MLPLFSFYRIFYFVNFSVLTLIRLLLLLLLVLPLHVSSQHFFDISVFISFRFCFTSLFSVYARVCTIYIENLSVICARISTHYLIWCATLSNCMYLYMCVHLNRMRITNLISSKVWCTNIQTHTWLLHIAQSAQQHSRENPIQKRYTRSVDKSDAMKHLRVRCEVEMQRRVNKKQKWLPFHFAHLISIKWFFH